ncbi:EAL domain-containing protein [Candidatus Weimeria sp. HCP3S3_B5]|uniref:EAL domain-containing protein n=1 Tax=Candidatus Weimeria sp. HCP3S3_B5 TaxID=3438871 RepID=UPI003F8BEB90
MTDKSVLIIDDSPTNRKMLADILKDEVDVLEADTGEKGLGLLKSHIGHIGIVLLDLIMPGMSGFDVLSEMKREHMMDYVPVIMISSADEPGNIEKAFDLGALDFISRPYSERIVRRRVLTTISLFQKQASIASKIDRQYKADDELIDKRTGLPYKKNFFNQVDTALRNPNLVPLYMVAMDIDHFKLFNSYYSWERGDEYIKKIGSILASSTQRHGGVAGYLGGDDFALLCPARFDLVNSLSEQLNRYLTENSFEPSFRTNFGIYSVDMARATDAKALYDLAAIALETIRGDYTRTVTVYDPAMIQKEQDEYKRLLNIRSGIKNGEFTIYIQPKVDMNTGHILGGEALARWIHDGTVYSPGLFVPVMEKNGLISSLDKLIWDRSARYIKKLIGEGINPLPISVNISTTDIFTMDVPEFFSELIRAYDIPPALLEAELSESTFQKAPERAADVVSRFHDIGMSVSYDDFGSGYAPLSTIESMDVDMLKIDTTFLRMSHENPERSRNILEPVLAMAQQIQLPVIIEGVETEGQADFLKRMGCYYAQGYLFYTPMPTERFTRLISDPAMVETEGLMIGAPQAYRVRQILSSDYISDDMVTNIFGSIVILNRIGSIVHVGWSLLDHYRNSSLQELVDKDNSTSMSDFVQDEDREKFDRLFESAVENKDQGAKGTITFVTSEGQIRVRIRLYYLRSNVNEQIFYSMLDQIDE